MYAHLKDMLAGSRESYRGFRGFCGRKVHLVSHPRWLQLSQGVLCSHRLRCSCQIRHVAPLHKKALVVLVECWLSGSMTQSVQSSPVSSYCMPGFFRGVRYCLCNDQGTLCSFSALPLRSTANSVCLPPAPVESRPGCQIFGKGVVGVRRWVRTFRATRFESSARR